LLRNIPRHSHNHQHYEKQIPMVNFRLSDHRRSRL
jgi:hypothetical protein